MKRFLFTNCTMVQGELFLVGATGGLLAKISPNDGKMSYCAIRKGFIPEEKVVLIDFMDNFQDNIYALDSRGEHLTIFELKSKECRYIPLNCAFQPGIKFVAFERFESDYFIFPKYGNRLLIFNIKNEKLVEIPNYLKGINELQCVCRVEESVWILPKDGNVIYCYNLSTGEKKVYKLGRLLRDCVHAVFNDGDIYILNMFGIIYKWDTKRIELLEITDLKINRDENKSMSRIICAGNKLILLPAFGNDIKILDLLTGKTEVYFDYPKDFFYKSTWLKYYGYCEDENFYYFAMCSGNYLLKIDKRLGKLRWIRPMIDYSLIRGRMELVKDKMFYEGIYEVVDLLSVITRDQIQLEEKFIGQGIYHWLVE